MKNAYDNTINGSTKLVKDIKATLLINGETKLFINMHYIIVCFLWVSDLFVEMATMLRSSMKEM